MRDGVKPENREPLEWRQALAPAEGLEPTASLFTAPPIESLELLRELGEIARRSLEPEMPVEAPTAAVAAASAAPSTPAKTEAKPAKSSDAQLIDALLEYHRLRGPTLGARTAAAKANGEIALADASTIPGERFSPVDIPVISEFEAKTNRGPFHSQQPVHAILRPKPPKP